MKQKCYKTERIRPLKTPRQVREHIRRQAWYRSFKDLVLMEWDRPLWKRLHTLWGFDGKKTIVNAFDWAENFYGYNHWAIINSCFEAWYEGKNQ